MAAAKIRTDGSADFTAAARSAVNVAMPQRRGMEDATKAMRITLFPSGRSFWRNAGHPKRGRRLGDRSWGVPEVSVPLTRVLDRQPCVPPSVETATQVRRDDAMTLEDPGREARTHTTRAIHDEHSLARQLADALLELLIRDMPRAG